MASGQALAKATRTRLAVSVTRAATLRRRKPDGCELGLGEGMGLGDGVAHPPRRKPSAAQSACNVAAFNC